jgi:Cdc6-like AAA superfamily ATPase
MAGFRKAKAEQAALKMGVYGPPGSGKTFTSLLLAEGLGKVSGKRDNPLLQVEKESFEGKIKKSLFQAINNETGSNWVASRFLDAFKTQMNVDKLPTGSEFQMVVEKIYDGPIFIGFGDVLEALLSTSGERLKKILFRDSANKGGVFVSEQDLSSTKSFSMPQRF